MLLANGVNLAPAQSIFEPASPAAYSIVNLAVMLLAVVALIFIVVEVILFFSVWRFRAGAAMPNKEPPQVYGSHAIETAWTAAPTLIVLFLVLVVGRTLWEVEAGPAVPQPNDPALLVTVIGHQWWWEYRYETYGDRTLGFVTANELHIPISEEGTPRPVYLRLEAADVCHSFWVPRLGGKMDLIPGRTNALTLETTEAGLYLGQCAEYCGAQHANMLIRVIAEPPEAFDRWLANQKQPAVDDPAALEGRETFLANSCINCHTVRGTPAGGTYAPDLTHLMSRETLASGEIANDLENLTAWVRDPQAIKPDCLMPAFGLTDRQRTLIVDYLRTLR